MTRESIRKERIIDAYIAIDKNSEINNEELTASICAETGCSWRTAREYVKIARIKHGTL